jgi:hypothetical protein
MRVGEQQWQRRLQLALLAVVLSASALRAQKPSETTKAAVPNSQLPADVRASLDGMDAAIDKLRANEEKARRELSERRETFEKARAAVSAAQEDARAIARELEAAQDDRNAQGTKDAQQTVDAVRQVWVDTEKRVAAVERAEAEAWKAEVAARDKALSARNALNGAMFIRADLKEHATAALNDPSRRQQAAKALAAAKKALSAPSASGPPGSPSRVDGSARLEPRDRGGADQPRGVHDPDRNAKPSGAENRRGGGEGRTKSVDKDGSGTGTKGDDRNRAQPKEPSGEGVGVGRPPRFR